MLPIQGGVHLSYLFTLGLGLLFGAALLLRRAHGLPRPAGRRRRCSWAGSSSPAPTTPCCGAPPSAATSSSPSGPVARGARRPLALAAASAARPGAAHPRLQPPGHRGLARVPDHGRRPPRHLRVRAPPPHADVRDRRLRPRHRRCGPRPRTRSCSPGSSSAATSGSSLAGWALWRRRRGTPLALPGAGHGGVPAGLLRVLGDLAVLAGLADQRADLLRPPLRAAVHPHRPRPRRPGTVAPARAWRRRWSCSPWPPCPSRSAGCRVERGDQRASRSPGARASPRSTAGPW